MDVVIYTRFSSNNQTEHSTERQIKYCKEFAERNDFNVIHIYTDEAQSGMSANRQQFKQMIKDSKNKRFQGVIVYSQDRFARNRYDSVTYKDELRKNGVRVFSVCENITDAPSGVIVESVFEGMAEFYSLELAQKASRGMAMNAEHCYFNGSVVPLGLKTKSIPVPIGANGKIKYKKILDIDEEKAPLVKEVYEMYLNGDTMENIAKYLNTKGIKKSDGTDRVFNKNSVKLILTNKRYIGSYTYKGEETPNAIPRIIDDETFYKIQEKIEKNKHAPAKNKAEVLYLLTTKLFCGTCKEMMVGVSATSGNGKRHYYYSCNGKRVHHKCKRKDIKRDYIESLVVDLARNSLTDENIEEIANAVYKTACKQRDNTRQKQLQREILNIEKQKANLFDSLKLCYDDNVKKSIFEEMAKMEKQKIEIENEIRIEKESIFDVTLQEIRYFLYHIKKVSENDIRYRQILIDVLIYKVYLYDDDSLTIVYNIKNKNGEMMKIQVPTMEELEKAFKMGDCSYLVQSSQPVILRLSRN